MKKGIATALLMAGLVPELAPARMGIVRAASTSSSTVLQAQPKSLFMRSSLFGRLRSVGWFHRHELLRMVYEDGRLWGEWGGYVRTQQPQLVETPELDAEWMAAAPRGDPRWLLGRRDLQAGADGDFWSVYCGGNAAEPAELNLVAIIYRDGCATTIVRYEQTVERASVLISGRWDGASSVVLRCAAANLAELIRLHPRLIQSQLAPGIDRLVGAGMLAVRDAPRVSCAT